MAELTRERREAIRAESALYHADIDVDSGDLSLTHAELRALLDAADERDRLREALAKLVDVVDEMPAVPDEDDWVDVALALGDARSLLDPTDAPL